MTGQSGTPRVGVRVVSDAGDHRGSSFSVPPAWRGFLPAAVDLHVTSLKSGHVRGNHFHTTLREVILVVHRDRWMLHWDEGMEGPAHRREFPGSGMVLITVEPGAAHAVENTGALDLWTFGLTDGPYNPAGTVRRDLVPPSG